MSVSGRPLTIGALFVSDWGHEFADRERGLVPAHRLFGLDDLAKAGHRVLHHTRRGAARPGRLPWRVAQALWVLRQQRRLDVVVATHEAAALPTLLLRRLRLVRRPVVVMTVAATDPRHGQGLRGRLVRAALRGADALTVFASVQAGPLAALHGIRPARVHVVPFGVDVEYFAPIDVPRERTVLAVGTNAGKDYPTLVRALPAGLPCVIVTDPDNREQAREHTDGKDVTFRSDVPIAELRDLYARAGVVVVPLRESEFSSGQTVLLENLAMGSPVVISDVTGVRDYVSTSGPRRPVTVVPPGDVVALAAAIVDALGTPTSELPREHVLAGFTGTHLASRLETVLRGVTG